MLCGGRHWPIYRELRKRAHTRMRVQTKGQRLGLAVRFREGRSGYLLRQTRRTRSHVDNGRGKRTANTLAILSRTLTA